jgi:PAS domain S-box-containing protein
MLGPTKHPAALGAPGLKVWAEISEIIGPMLRGVMERGEATRSRDLLLHIDREGYPEEAYFSFSYSPIYEENGKVGGVFCPVIETTEKVIGERRLRTLRDLAAACQGESETLVYESAARVLAANPYDVPFAMIYRVDHGQSVATLEATAGIQQGAAAAPAKVTIAGEADVWSLNSVAQCGTAAVVGNLSDYFKDLPSGAWKTAPHSAMVLPVLLPGQARPRAVLVAAASPMRALNEDYRTFFGLIATQIASGLADAQALEEERRRAEALAEIDRAKTAFFSNVSHEFRTPLTLMLGPVEELLAGRAAELAPAARSQLELVNRNGRRLLRLVNTLLDFSRIEAGRVQASYEGTDLASLTSELSSVFRAATDRAGLQLIVDCRKISESVYVDRDMWEKIVLNLISNAFKFTFEGHIAVTLEEAGGQAVLKVSDTGVGIPAEEIPRVFERFHRVSSTRSRTHEGSGIGLALVQELVKLHGGSGRAESVLGKGTTFVVSIPLGTAHLPQDRLGAQRTLASTATGAAPFVEEALRWLPGETESRGWAAEQEAVVEPAQPRLGEESNGKRRSRVIVADDNADMRQYVQRLLSERYDVEAVGDGAAALAAAMERRPDLILSDVMMPNMDGFALLERVRKDTALRDVPVILLSARAGEESRVQGLDIGADDYLVKPFSARELLARIESHLNLARMRHESEQRVTGILSSITDGFHVVDGNGRFTEFNAAARKLFATYGLDVDTLIGKHVFDDVFPLTRNVPMGQALTRALTERVPTAAENFYEPWQRWFNVRHYPMPDGGVATFFQDTTERKRARAKFESVFNQSGIFAGIMDLDGNLREVNDLALNACGYKREDVLDRPFWETAWWRNSEVVKERIQHATKEACAGRVFREILPYWLADGTQRIVDFAMHPIRDETGQVMFLHPTGIDITERRQAEQALRRSEEHLALLSNTVPALISYVGSDRCYRSCNQAYSAWFEMPREQIVGRSVRDVVGEDAWKVVGPRIERAFAGEAVEYEGEVHYSRGGTRWIHGIYTPHRGEGGIVEGVVVLVTDITVHKQSEAKIAELADDLRRRLEENETLLRALPVGVFVAHDADCHQITMNPAGAAMLRLPFDANASKTAADAGRLPFRVIKDGREVADGDLPMQRAARIGQPVVGEEVDLSFDDGTSISLFEHASPLFDEVGKVRGCLGVFVDLTERKRAEEALRQAKEELERANQELEKRVQERTARLRETISELESYSYSISHDMRAPLRAMQAYAQVLVDELGPQLDDSNRRYLDRITAAANRLDRLITDVLSYSRISRADMDLRPIDLDGLVEEIAYQYPALQRAEIRVDGPLGTVLAAEALLTQAIANILTNAVKFMEKGVTPKIRISSEERGRGTGGSAEDQKPIVRILFQDNGIGIAHEDQDRIFGIFARVHSEKEYEGTGIGLSVVKRAIERMGGAVGVESELGRGSTFWIELQQA